MRFIDYDEKIFAEVIHQAFRAGARRASRKVPRIVLDAVTKTRLFEHFHIVTGALGDTLRFDEFSYRLKIFYAHGELGLDYRNGVQDFLRLGQKVLGRIYIDFFKRAQTFGGKRIYFGYALDDIAEKLNPDARFQICRKHVDDIAFHAEMPSGRLKIISGILHGHKFPQKIPDALGRPFFDENREFFVVLGRAQIVNAGYRRHYDNVPARHQRRRGFQTEPVDMFVDGGVLFYESIRPRNIRFGLVVIVVRDEIFYGVFGKEFLEFRVKLRGQNFIGRDYQGGFLEFFYDGSNYESFAGAGNAEQKVVLLAGTDSVGESVYSPRLVAGGRKRRYQLKSFSHFAVSPYIAGFAVSMRRGVMETRPRSTAPVSVPFTNLLLSILPDSQK